MPSPASRWVAGAYFSNANTDINYVYRTDPAVMDAALRLMYGDMSGPGTNQSEGTARYGVVNDGGFQANLRADIQDKESAAFVEGELLDRARSAARDRRHSLFEIRARVQRSSTTGSSAAASPHRTAR